MDKEQKIHHLKSKIEEVFSGSFAGDEEAKIEHIYFKFMSSEAIQLQALIDFFRAEKEKQKATLLSLIDDLPESFFGATEARTRSGFELDNGTAGISANTY